MNNKKLVWPLLAVNLIALIDSIYLTWHHYKIEIAKPISSSFCTINSFIDCDSVALSSYSRVLGIPSAGLGIFAYLFLAVIFIYLAFFKKEEKEGHFQLSFLVLATMFLFSLRMFLASLFFVKAVCIMCIGLYVSVGAMAALNYFINGGVRLKEGLSVLLDLAVFKNKKDSSMYFMALLISALAAVGVSLSIKGHFLNLKPEVKPAAAKAKSQLDIYSEMKVFEIDYSGLPSKGPDDAPFVFLEVSDFECPYCSMRAEGINRLYKNFEGLIKVYFLNYPLDQNCNKKIKRKFHDNACQAAGYAICANQADRFWEYHDYLFRNQKKISGDFLKDSVRKMSFDQAEFNKCLKEFAQGRLMKDLDISFGLNVSYTPTIFLNGRKISDKFQREEQIASLLEKIIKESVE